MKRPKRKVLSVFLSLLLIFPSNMINYFANAEVPDTEIISPYGDPWDGSVEENISSFVTGKVARIEKVAQLIALIREFNKEDSSIPQDIDIQLVDSLDFAGITETNDGQALTDVLPLGTQVRTFKGKFGSNNSIKAGIKNLTLKNDESEDVGFFGVVEGATIHDLYFDSSVNFEANGLQYKMAWEYDRNEKNADPKRKNGGDCGLILETTGEDNIITNVVSYASFASNGAEGRDFTNRNDWGGYYNPKLTNTWRDKNFDRRGQGTIPYGGKNYPEGLRDYQNALNDLSISPVGKFGRRLTVAPLLTRSLACKVHEGGNLWSCGSDGRSHTIIVGSPDFRIRLYNLCANKGEYEGSFAYALKQSLPDNCALGSLTYTISWGDDHNQTHTIAKTIPQNNLQEVMQLRVPAEVPTGAKVKLEGTLLDPADSDKYQVIGCNNFTYLNPDNPFCTAVVAVIPLHGYLSKTSSFAWQRLYMVDIIPESRQLLPEEFAQLKFVHMPTGADIFLDKYGNKVTELDDGQNIYDFINENCMLDSSITYIWQRRNRSYDADLADSNNKESLNYIEEHSDAVCAIKDAYELPDGGNRYNVCVNNETDPELLFDENLTKCERCDAIPKVNLLQSINFLFEDNQQEWENVFNGGDSGAVGFVARANGQTLFSYCNIHGSFTSNAGNAKCMIAVLQDYDDENNDYFIKEEDGHEGFSAKTYGGNSNNVGSLFGQSDNNIKIENCFNYATIASYGGETEIASTVNEVFTFVPGTCGHAGGFGGDAGSSSQGAPYIIEIIDSENHGDVYSMSNSKDSAVGAEASYAGGALGFAVANVYIINFVNAGNVNADGSNVDYPGLNKKDNIAGTVKASVIKNGHSGMKGCTCAANGGNGGRASGAIGGAYSKKITIQKVTNSGKISANGGSVGESLDIHNQGKFGNAGNGGFAGGLLGENNAVVVIIKDGKNVGEISANGGNGTSDLSIVFEGKGEPPYRPVKDISSPYVENYNGGRGGSGGSASAAIGMDNAPNSDIDISVFMNSGSITANGGLGGRGMSYTDEEKAGNGAAAGSGGNVGVVMGYTNGNVTLNDILNTGTLYTNGSNSGSGGHKYRYVKMDGEGNPEKIYEYGEISGDASKTAGMGGNTGIIGSADVNSVLNLSNIFNLGSFYANGGELGSAGNPEGKISGRTPYLFGEGTGGNIGTIGLCKAKNVDLRFIYISPEATFEAKSNVFGRRAGSYGGATGRFDGGSIRVNDLWNCAGSVNALNTKTQSAGHVGSLFGYFAPTEEFSIQNCNCWADSFSSGVGKIDLKDFGSISDINRKVRMLPQEEMLSKISQALEPLKIKLGVE